MDPFDGYAKELERAEPYLPPRADEEKEKVRKELQDRFDKGEPFHDQRDIEMAGKQIARSKPGDMVLTKGVGSHAYKFQIQPREWGVPQVELRSFHQIMERGTYCNILIEHSQPDSRIQFPLDKVKQNFKRARIQLEGLLREKLSSALNDGHIPPGIDQIIAVACGSMSYDTLPRPSAYQNALVCALRTILQEDIHRSSGDIKCYSQDPKFTDADKYVLGQSRIDVLNNPEGFVKVNNSTAFLSFSPDTPVKEIIRDIGKRPALLIWDRVVDKSDQGTEWDGPNKTNGDADSAHVRKMIREEYRELDLEFPEEFGTNEVVQYAVYVRRLIE
ncbi:hypothetical protein FQN52_009637 [Onygenales sp. PD_12]|nr:hypothetical protein FQN53_001144 [Emmonsiellopsis sp. PD_33]KAK2783379.1 hypothetical protein FQN52_009637 [Onygenales sp. PD_12]KAK2792344.1 hypothetical protein FQN51_001736 [Onygenales sp. PD_10]